MYDAFSRAAVDTNVVAREWFTYNMDNFIQRDAAGNIVSATLYFDPTANVKMNHTPAVLLGLVFYALPQATGHARAMYEAAVEDLQWRDESVPIAVSTRNMRNAMLGLIIARDLGDSLVASRLAAALEPLLEPRFFGKGDAEFGFFFHLAEPYPRGQLTSLMMLAELMDHPGLWSQTSFNTDRSPRLQEPTVEGVAFPDIGLSVAANDGKTGTLHIETYAGSAAALGKATSFRITNVPTRTPVVVRDGAQHDGWKQDADTGIITVSTAIGAHHFAIFTGCFDQAAKM